MSENYEKRISGKDEKRASPKWPDDAYARLRQVLGGKQSAGPPPPMTEVELDRRQLRALWKWHKSYSIGWILGAIGIIIYLFVFR